LNFTVENTYLWRAVLSRAELNEYSYGFEDNGMVRLAQVLHNLCTLCPKCHATIDHSARESSIFAEGCPVCEGVVVNDCRESGDPLNADSCDDEKENEGENENEEEHEDEKPVFKLPGWTGQVLGHRWSPNKQKELAPDEIPIDENVEPTPFVDNWIKDYKSGSSDFEHLPHEWQHPRRPAVDNTYQPSAPKIFTAGELEEIGVCRDGMERQFRGRGYECWNCGESGHNINTCMKVHESWDLDGEIQTAKDEEEL
jgi:hypothetical protein